MRLLVGRCRRPVKLQLIAATTVGGRLTPPREQFAIHRDRIIVQCRGGGRAVHPHCEQYDSNIIILFAFSRSVAVPIQMTTV